MTPNWPKQIILKNQKMFSQLSTVFDWLIDWLVLFLTFDMWWQISFTGFLKEMSFVALSVMFQFRFLQYWLPRRYLLVQSQQQRHQNNVWKWFKVKNKGNGTTSITSMLSLLLTLNRLFWSLCRSLFWSSYINLKFLMLNLKK